MVYAVKGKWFCLKFQITDRIPINFEHERKKFTGHFSKVIGAGSTAVWHLNDDKGNHLGRRCIGWKDQWYFDGSKTENKLEELAQYFGEYVTALIEQKTGEFTPAPADPVSHIFHAVQTKNRPGNRSVIIF